MPIHLLLAADAPYGPWAGLTLSSALAASRDELFHVHLLSDGVRRRDIRRMLAVASNAAILSVYDVGPLLEREGVQLKVTHHVTRTAYARLFLDRLLPETVERVLYLDCDVLVRKSLRPLWKLGEGLPLFGAVREAGDVSERKAALAISEGPYYNSGVMLINVDAWRRQGVSGRLMDFITREPEKIRWFDQDAINAVLWREAQELPEQWNVQLNEVPASEAERRLSAAAIVHFNGRHKPWQLDYSGGGAELFHAVKRASPWRWRLPEPRFVARARKLLRKRLSRYR